ncbi:MAG: hypothetical protein JWQ35_61 [Bacteriovoracaceae bacterium]|nr:hypothetical protein [Bacteriovoracaceae bacterium]
MVRKNWISGVKFFVIFLGLSVSQAFAAPQGCGDKLSKIARARLDTNLQTENLDKLSNSLMSWLHRERSIPDMEELATYANVDLAKVPAKKNQRQLIADLVSYAKQHQPEEHQKVKKAVLKEVIGFMEEHYREPTKEELANLLGVPDSDLEIVCGSTDNLFEQVKSVYPAAFERLQNRIAFSYARMAMKTGRTPTHDEIAGAMEISTKELDELLKKGELFKSYEEIKAKAIALRPKSFSSVIDTDVFTEEKTMRLVEAIENRKTMIHTTAVAGSPVNETFLKALLKAAEELDAEIIVRPQNMITTGLDPILLSTPRVHIVLNTVELGETLALRKTPLTAKQIKPLMGLNRIGQRGQMEIFSSPKMMVDTVPTIENSDSPHITWTTGAITDPYYAGPKYIQGRTDEIATEDHVMGAVIIEKDMEPNGKVIEESKNDFHIRHVEFIPEKKGFADLNKFYTPDSVTTIKRMKVLNLGDSHPGDTDPVLFATLPELVSFLNPEEILIEDGFNGHSLSHHNEDKLMTRSELVMEGKLDVWQEILLAAGQMAAIQKMAPDAMVIMKNANHNNWMTRWLESGKFMNSDINRTIGVELLNARLQAKKQKQDLDPLEYAFLKTGLLDPKRVKFLKVGEKDHVGPKHRRVYTHLHGDFGANGTKASLEAIRQAAGRAMTAHTHTYKRLNGVVSVGTITKYILSYNKQGFSNWVQSVGIIGENGEEQILMFRNGRWFAPRDTKAPSAKKFFAPGYPEVIPNNKRSDGEGQVDQHGGG